MVQHVPIGAMADTLVRDDAVVVDVRPAAAFNGWALQGEPRGGHVPGAVAFTGSWLRGDDRDEVIWALEDKGVTPDRTVVLYGYGSDDAGSAAEGFERLGFEDVGIQPDGFQAWAADPSRPLTHLPLYRRLVHPGWLARVLDGGADLPTPAGKRLVLVHVTWKNRADYDRAHIPGAIHLDTMTLEEPERWNRRTHEELEAALLAHGIAHDTAVVLYGHTGRPTMSQEEPGREAGQLAAMRAAHLLMYAGVEDLRVLDGGLNAWEGSGLPVTDRETAPTPVESFGREIPGRPDLVVDTDEAREMLAAEAAELVSVRSWAEFIGELSGYHYVSPRGRIPGAVFGNCGSDAYHMQNYRNDDNTMRSYEEIAGNWREVGVLPDKHVAFYCGTGWRASEAFFCAHLMGWDRIAVYDGGWYEWSVDAGNPVETGAPADRPEAFRDHPG